MENPYKNSKDYQMWRRAVSRVEAHDVDPVTNPRFRISASSKVSTAGSCFAQHIAKRISEIGFNYFCTERDDSLSEQEAIAQGYGVFSARYGNIYTIQQLWQIFEEAFGRLRRHETAWRKGTSYVDPYRPTVFPAGFPSVEALLEARRQHLSCIRKMFEECDVFVFTLGLTEGWRSKVDHSVFPLAPGVAGGSFDPQAHEFFNASIDETRAELFAFIEALTACNPQVKILLTVSPVPLIATYEDRHVLTSTVYSKSVLRVAAQEAFDRYACVDYFPSYEIITGSPTGGMYFEDDMREVNSVGVSHAMRCFLSGYTATGGRGQEPVQSLSGDGFREAYKAASTIICDEEEIERSMKS